MSPGEFDDVKQSIARCSHAAVLQKIFFLLVVVVLCLILLMPKHKSCNGVTVAFLTSKLTLDFIRVSLQ